MIHSIYDQQLPALIYDHLGEGELHEIWYETFLGNYEVSI